MASNKFFNSKGFSLLELVVVLTIFLIVVSVTINIFLSLVKSQKRVLEEQELLNQASFAFEYMSQALGSAISDTAGDCLGVPGYIYLLTHCPNGDLSACNGIKFINSDGTCQEFFLDDSVNPVNPPLREIKDGALAQNLLSSKLVIKYGRFIINGDKTLHYVASDGLISPRVTFLLDVSTQSGESEKIIQNTVAKMNLNQGEGAGGGGLFCTPGNFPQCVPNGPGVSCVTSLDCPTN